MSGERPGMSGERPGMSGERPGMSGERPGYVRGAAGVCQGSGRGMSGERLGYLRGAYLRRRGKPTKKRAHRFLKPHSSLPALERPIKQ